jgi:two-component system OmpR family response regulator
VGGTILVVDDDPHIREVMRFALDKAGFATIEAGDGKRALRAFGERRTDLIVLDVGMPELDGLACAGRSASRPTCPSSSSRPTTRRRTASWGSRSAATTMWPSPSARAELVARVKVILKRLRPPEPAAAEATALDHGLVHLDSAQHLATYAERPVSLTATEFALLREFMRRPQHVRDRNSLIAGIYAANGQVSDRTVDSHIRHIRSKFEAVGCRCIIETLHGVGYKLGQCR